MLYYNIQSGVDGFPWHVFACAKTLLKAAHSNDVETNNFGGSTHLKRLAGLGIAAVLITGGVYTYAETGLLGGKDGTSKPSATPATPATVALAKSSDVPEYIMGVGAAQALKTVVVRARVDGEMTEVNFTEGQEVREGDVLVRLDSRQIEAQIRQTEANLERDQTAIEQSNRDVARARDLFSKGAGPQLNLDNAKTTLAAAKAALAGDQALLDNQKVQLTWYTLTAPISGRTGVRRVDPGNIVHSSDAGGIVTITQLQPAAVLFSLSQDALDRVKAAMKAGPLDVVAYDRDGSNQLGVGKLQLIDNQVDTSSGTISLKAIVPNEDERLWPGEFVSVKLVLGVRKNATTIPATAAQRGQAGYFVFVAKSDNTVERRAVEIADIRDNIAIVTNGLKPGETVVTDGQYKLRPGQRIAIQPPKEKPPTDKSANAKPTGGATAAAVTQ